MLNQLFQSVFVYFRLCFLKETPAALPFSNVVLFFMIGCNLLLRVLSLETTTGISLSQMTSASIMSLVLLLITLYFLVSYTKKQERWHKLASAMVGVEVVLFCILQPITLLMPGQQMSFSMALPIVIWTLAIKGNILKKTLEFRLLNSILLVFLIEIISYIPFGFLITEATVR